MTWKDLYNRSYTKKRGTPKACVIQGKSGKYYAGVRIENTSYPLTITAIQAACCICLSEGDMPTKLILKENQLDQQDFWVKEFNLAVAVQNTLEEIKLEAHTYEIAREEEKDQLKQLLDSAVIPNSDFPVSALLFTAKGMIKGVNVEVSEWSKGLCAERVALAKAISYGIDDFERMAVHTRFGQFCSPCGACRQVVFEHLDDHPMDFFHPDGTQSRHYTVDLLPFSFKSNNL